MRYNLVDEPWIPCLLPEGQERCLSLAEALHHAPDVVEVLDPSPLVTVALYRLLLAVLHRVFGPEDDAAWGELWARDSFDSTRLTDYLARWRPRFDLFDPKRPFGQCPGLPERLAAPVTRLAAELTSGNQPTLFNHTTDDAASAMNPAAAARCLLAHQSFCLSGCLGDEGGLTAVRSGTLAHAAVFLLTGRSLFETLLLNLVPYSTLHGIPLPAFGDDIPQWERSSLPAHETRLPDGYLDYLTWPSRRVMLVREGAEVSRVIVMPGADCPPEAVLRDPMVAYRGTAALRLEPGGSWWRDCLGLFAACRTVWQRPLTLERLASRLDCGMLAPDCCYSLSVIGLAGAKARTDYWQHYRQPAPADYLCDEDLAADLDTALGLAEEIQQALAAALWQAAQALAFGPAGSPEPLKRMAGGASSQAYWRALEPSARALVYGLPGSLTHRDEVLQAWLQTCQRLAWRELEAQISGLRHELRGLRAEALAREHLARALGRVAAPWQEVASEAI